ncbi:peptidoglycan-binding protein LysM [Myroides odoratus]|uniref:peptidoglycan-binding protein LysM n=1 Tax=Myroides odoratus TaxID=256 RepID=UPI0039B12233
MRKKCSFIIGFLLLLGGVFSGFKKYEVILLEQYKILPEKELSYQFPDENITEEKKTEIVAVIPFTGKTYIGFKQALAARESNGLYRIVNSFGYIGKYQFGRLALRSIGIFDSDEFLNDPLLQEKAFDALVAKNKWILRNEIKTFDGRRIDGIKITESGILAAAHLGGAGSVRKYLKSNGANSFRDGFGTSIKTYLKKFSGFDVSEIDPEKNALVLL